MDFSEYWPTPSSPARHGLGAPRAADSPAAAWSHLGDLSPWPLSSSPRPRLEHDSGPGTPVAFRSRRTLRGSAASSPATGARAGDRRQAAALDRGEQSPSTFGTSARPAGPLGDPVAHVALAVSPTATSGPGPPPHGALADAVLAELREARPADPGRPCTIAPLVTERQIHAVGRGARAPRRSNHEPDQAPRRPRRTAGHEAEYLSPGFDGKIAVVTEPGRGSAGPRRGASPPRGRRSPAWTWQRHAKATVADIEGAGATVPSAAYHCDVTNEGSVERTVERVAAELGAQTWCAMWPASGLRALDRAVARGWNRIIAVNLTGTSSCAVRHSAPARLGGSITTSSRPPA